MEFELELDACTDGIAVVRDGALLYERYGGEMDETSLHLSQSVGKSVVGLTAGIVGVDPAALVTDFVPEVRGSGYDGATVRHLLDMTAAIDFVEDYESFVALRRRLRVASADHRQPGHDPRVPGDDRPGRAGHTASAGTTPRRTRTCSGSSSSAPRARRWRR